MSSDFDPDDPDDVIASIAERLADEMSDEDLALLALALILTVATPDMPPRAVSENIFKALPDDEDFIRECWSRSK